MDYKLYDEIEQKIKGGHYETKLSYPKRELFEPHISPKSQYYAAVLEEYNKAESKFQEERKAYRDNVSLLEKDFCNDLARYINSYGAQMKKVEKIICLAEESHRSEGRQAVLEEVERLCEAFFGGK